MLKPLRNHYDYFEHRLSEHEAGEAEALGESEKTNAYYDQLNQASQFPSALPMQNKISLVDANGQFANLDASAKSLTGKMASIMDNTIAASIVQKLAESKDATAEANIYLLNSTWPIVQQKIRKLIVPGNPISAQSMYRILISYLVNTFGKDYPSYAKDQWINDDSGDLQDIAVAPPLVPLQPPGSPGTTQVPPQPSVNPPGSPIVNPPSSPGSNQAPPLVPNSGTSIPGLPSPSGTISPLWDPSSPIPLNKPLADILAEADPLYVTKARALNRKEKGELTAHFAKLYGILKKIKDSGDPAHQFDQSASQHLYLRATAEKNTKIHQILQDLANGLNARYINPTNLFPAAPVVPGTAVIPGHGFHLKRGNSKRANSTQVQILEGEIRAGNDNPSIRSVLHKLVRRR